MEATLTGLDGSLAGKVINLPEGKTLRLGRDPLCEVVLTEFNASRVHARLVWSAGGLTAENLSATNGIRINGQRQERTLLKLGDVISIGQSSLRVDRLPDSTVVGDDWRMLVDCLFAMQRILSEDGDRLVARSLETLFMALPASRLALFTVGEEGVLTQSHTVARRTGGTASMSLAFAKRVVEAGAPVLLDGEPVEGDWNRTLQEQHVRSILGVPVPGPDGTPMAVILADNLDEPGRLGDPHLRLCALAAQGLAFVFQRERLRLVEISQARTEREFLAARRVQAQIFTKDPAALLGPLDWAVAYRPALELGGDFYDFHHDGHGTTWVVADVSGKGVPAALVVSLLKGLCKTLYPRVIDPARFLIELDRLTRGELPQATFFSACCFRIEDATGRLTWANLGHPAMLVRRADGSVEELSATPGMLGVDFLPLPKPETRACMLAPGDLVMACTDGLAEAMDPEGNLLGEERVHDILIDPVTAPGQLIERTLAMVAAHQRGASPSDDLTLVIGLRPLPG